MNSKDLERMIPGDLLEVQDGEHQNNFEDAQSQAGGTTSHQGQGGDRVWKESLLPAEKKALQNFFK